MYLFIYVSNTMRGNTAIKWFQKMHVFLQLYMYSKKKNNIVNIIEFIRKKRFIRENKWNSKKIDHLRQFKKESPL